MVAICFYTFESYNQLKEEADDKEGLCDTYSDWLVEFTKAVNILKEQGLEVVPVNVNIEDLKKWCRRNKIKNTSASRSKYAIELGKSQS